MFALDWIFWSFDASSTNQLTHMPKFPRRIKNMMYFINTPWQFLSSNNLAVTYTSFIKRLLSGVGPRVPTHFSPHSWRRKCFYLRAFLVSFLTGDPHVELKVIFTILFLEQHSSRRCSLTIENSWMSLRISRRIVKEISEQKRKSIYYWHFCHLSPETYIWIWLLFECLFPLIGQIISQLYCGKY